MPLFPLTRRRKLAAAGTLALAVALFAACGGCVVRITEQDLFHPRRVVARAEGLPGIEPLELAMDDGVRLRGWRIAPPASAVPASDGELLFLLGNADTAAWRLGHARHLAAVLGLHVSVVDYRGFGASEGAPSLARCAKDVLAIHDALQARDPARKVAVYGYSIGTGFASQLAAKRPPRFLVLQAPPTSCEEVIAAWDANLPWYAGWCVRLKPAPALLDPSLRPIDFIQKVECPLLVVHGTADTVIPFAMGQAMFDKAGSARKEFLPLPDLGHNDMPPDDPRVDAALKRVKNGD